MTPLNNMAPITAIVPCYRCMDSIERALDSILTQTFQVAEIILVDDASGDETLEMLYCLQDAKNDERIKIIALAQNSGPGSARNAAWEVASQPWLAFLDADDAWHPRKIEIQYTWMLKQQDVFLCAHETELWRLGMVEPSYDSSKPVRLSAKKMLFRNPIPTRSVILKRELPFRFAGKQQAEDYLLWLEVSLSGYACWKIPIVLAYSFRPEFSPGGYSGALWTHEKWELKGYDCLKSKKLINSFEYVLASTFSLLKYLRRVFRSNMGALK